MIAPLLRGRDGTLSNDFYSHLADEERIVFPALVRYLTVEELDSISVAMRVTQKATF